MWLWLVLVLMIWRINDLYILIAVCESYLRIVMWCWGKDSAIEILVVEWASGLFDWEWWLLNGHSCCVDIYGDGLGFFMPWVIRFYLKLSILDWFLEMSLLLISRRTKLIVFCIWLALNCVILSDIVEFLYFLYDL